MVSQVLMSLHVEARLTKVYVQGSATFTITNGLGGKVQPGATIHAVAANSKGQVTVVSNRGDINPRTIHFF